MPHTSAAVKALAVALAFHVAGAAQAAITSTTSASTFATATAAGPKGVDSYNDLSINSFLSGPLNRSAGIFGYAVASASGGADDFFVLPNAGNPALSINTATDAMVFTFTGLPVLAFGGNFFASNSLGEVASGTLRIVAIDNASNTLSSNFTLTASTANFIGLLSDRPLVSVSVVAVQPIGISSSWASVDNLNVAQVPEPGSWALMAGGMGLIGLAGLRRRTRR